MTVALRHRLLIALLAFVLVGAQALGLVHRIVHAPLAGGTPAATAAVDDAGVPTLKALFSGHDSDPGCRLFDVLGQGAAPCAEVVVLPLSIGSFVLDHVHGEFIARWAALFDARGPPSLR